MRGKPQLVIALLLLVAAGLGVGGASMAWDMLLERQELLIQNLESEMNVLVASVANLVSERAREIRGDLLTAAELAVQRRGSSQASLELIRAQLIALDQSTRHYRILWHVRAGEPVIEVGGFRRSALPLPDVDQGSLHEVSAAATAVPGRIVTLVPQTLKPTPFERLQLFALANRKRPSEVVVILVSMDALFDSLERIARLPGAYLWVIDGAGNSLVLPQGVSSLEQERVKALLAGNKQVGAAMLGSVPPPWTRDVSNVAASAKEPKLVVWRSAQGPTLPWNTAMVASLRRVTSELKETAARFLALGLGALVVFLALVLAAIWLYRRHRRLKNRMVYREQLARAERLSALGQIAAGVAHEVGTPLGILAIRLDQLLAKEKLADEHEKIRVMREQIDRISRILDRMLDYARPRMIDVKQVSLRWVIGRVFALVEHRAQSKGIIFKSHLSDDVCVLSDSDQLHQVFLNLIVNAIDACGAGDRITIERLHEAPPDRLRVRIRDTGCGIPEQALTAVFDPFFSTKPAGEGTGLGLTIVRDILERQDGSIEASMSVDGTCFVLDWPQAIRSGGSPHRSVM